MICEIEKNNWELYLRQIEILEKEGKTKEATDLIAEGLKELRKQLKRKQSKRRLKK